MLCINFVPAEDSAAAAVALRNSSLAMQLCLNQVTIVFNLETMFLYSVHIVVPSATKFKVWSYQNILHFSKNRYKQMNNQAPSNFHDVGGDYIDLTATDSEEEWQRGSGETFGSVVKDRNRSIIPSNFRTWEPITEKKIASDGCYPRNLKWKKRSKLLYDEIVNLGPDILCLQEVQATHLNTFFSKFENIGYHGVFKQKTGNKFDGCAIYFKKSLFDMVDCLNVEFLQPQVPILNRDNIGLMVKLVPRSSPNCPFIVATTHLLYNPKRTDVRLAQIQVFLAEIDRFAYDNNSKESGHLPIILTGDLNSTPDSAVIQLLDNGRVSTSTFHDNSDWQKIGVTNKCQHLSVHLKRGTGQNVADCNTVKLYNSDYSLTVSSKDYDEESSQEEYSKLFNSNVLEHQLPLTSVYKKIKSDGQLEATTFQDFWITVDYIYFSRHRHLNLLERLRLPTAAECQALGRLPNDVYGSDHLALGAVFELKPFKCSL
ncbi:Protein angel homolog 2 [Eumeta japonica]|uniref:Protein angel homolog 2 n=1 Tax=Eumeta variegata TaxID=151549 RepID=A0A4C2A096_EUMVA|nr:Protein angel homolog 2 [Eumeta japonica]